MRPRNSLSMLLNAAIFVALTSATVVSCKQQSSSSVLDTTRGACVTQESKVRELEAESQRTGAASVEEESTLCTKNGGQMYSGSCTCTDSMMDPYKDGCVNGAIVTCDRAQPFNVSIGVCAPGANLTAEGGFGLTDVDGMRLPVGQVVDDGSPAFALEGQRDQATVRRELDDAKTALRLCQQQRGMPAESTTAATSSPLPPNLEAFKQACSAQSGAYRQDDSAAGGHKCTCLATGGMQSIAGYSGGSTVFQNCPKADPYSPTTEQLAAFKASCGAASGTVTDSGGYYCACKSGRLSLQVFMEVGGMADPDYMKSWCGPTGSTTRPTTGPTTRPTTQPVTQACRCTVYKQAGSFFCGYVKGNQAVGQTRFGPFTSQTGAPYLNSMVCTSSDVSGNLCANLPRPTGC